MAKKDIAALPESGKVTVACNVPNGVVLKLYNWDTHDEPVLGGGTRERRVAVETGQTVTLFGPAVAKGDAPKCIIIRQGNSQYALTPNVDAQFMREWFKQNEQSPLVKNKGIFAYAKTASARDAAKDFAKDFKSGLEPLVPGVDAKGAPNDPRVPRSKNRHITSIDTGERA